MKVGFIDFQKADVWIERKLGHPGISEDELALRKAYWMASLVCALVIIALTVTFKLVKPGLKILFAYGVVLGLLFLEWVIELLILHYNIEKRMFINQVLTTLLTFGAILLLGGIPTSGGLVFVGFFVVLFSLDFKKRIYSRWLFIIYVLTLVLAGLLQPYLSVPPEMTRGVNVSLYVINLLWISSLSFLFVLNFIRERVKIEQREAERLKETDMLKSRLYSNITHEFRTPLTIILGMAGLIREKPGEWVEKGTQKIEDHSRILLHHVNMMLDLAKVESSSMPLHMKQGDIIPFLGQIVELFRSSADEKSIALGIKTELRSFEMDYDAEKILQILSNLLSNALKYTGKGGRVEFSAASLDEGKKLEIIVRDNGPGIPQESLPHIFDRFYRVEQGNEQSIDGTGLGLALTRELVRLLGGEIRAESEAGKGAGFIIHLPVSRQAPKMKGSALTSLDENLSDYYVHRSKPGQPGTGDPDYERKDGNTEKAGLLIVEDNQDVIDYLRTIVDPLYNVITARDGEAGFDAALEHIPDIIISDVMMPEMDGIQLLESLKSDMRTSHIPVIMLTARADMESRLKGLERGAEAYLAKPFNRDELLIRLKTLVNLRTLLHARYADQNWVSQKDEKAFSMEDEFISKVQQAMDQHMHDEDFDIGRLSKTLSMSRSQLYRKFKSLTNKTIGEYLRTYRLLKARLMLESGQANVSEAAFQCGFRNLSHFSRVFTSEFGQKPSDVLNTDRPSRIPAS